MWRRAFGGRKTLRKVDIYISGTAAVKIHYGLQYCREENSPHIIPSSLSVCFFQALSSWGMMGYIAWCRRGAGCPLLSLSYGYIGDRLRRGANLHEHSLVSSIVRYHLVPLLAVRM